MMNTEMRQLLWYQSLKINPYLIVVALTFSLIIIGFITNSGIVAYFIGGAAAVLMDPIIWPIFLLPLLWRHPKQVLLLALIYAGLVRIYIDEVLRFWEELGMSKPPLFGFVNLVGLLGPLMAVSIIGAIYDLFSFFIRKKDTL